VRDFRHMSRFLSCVFISLCFGLIFGETSYGGENGSVAPVEEERVYTLTQVIERARYANRYLLQNALLVQSNRYSLQSVQSLSLIGKFVPLLILAV